MTTRTGIVAENDISTLTFGHNLGVGSLDVFGSGGSMLAIVHNNSDVFFLEAVTILDIFLHLLIYI
jgi:hypothetical protein